MARATTNRISRSPSTLSRPNDHRAGPSEWLRAGVLGWAILVPFAARAEEKGPAVTAPASGSAPGAGSGAAMAPAKTNLPPKADQPKSDQKTDPTAKAVVAGKPDPTVKAAEPGKAEKPAPARPGGIESKKPDSDDQAQAKAGTKPETKKTETRAKAPKKATGAGKQSQSHVGEGPSPASPPPLTIGGLHDEIRREAAPVTIDPAAPARTKVEQMLVEIGKTREALHEDTARLEGMLGDGAVSAPGGASGAGAVPTAGGGKPAPKNPLDILAKALRGIKPDQAAPIVARIDKRLAATILQRMPPVDAGKILGAMKPDTAAELATQIAMRMPLGEMKR